MFEQAALAEQRALAPNAGARCGIRSVDAFGSVSPLALELLTRDERFARLSPARQAALLDAELFLLPLPDYQALKSTPARGELWVHGQQQRPPKHLLVGNRRCPPWGYLIGAARRVESTSAALEALLAPDHDPRRQVVIGPEGRDLQAPAGTLPARPVAPSRFEPERIELELELREPAWLVLRETFSPHWEARVDGALVPCARADLLYRALPLEAGRHRVVLRYAPSWWWPGLAASALGWALLAALALSSLRKASRPGA
ncbi:MAG TPA: hypothetical protein DEA08_07205 [Planctomycetes bacterium]|nr:hypothetical protein [Planctomycetota bacterium]